MKHKHAACAALVLSASLFGSAHAALVIEGSVGGAPNGVILDNLDWISLGNTSGQVSPVSGITINFIGATSQAVTGSVGGQYAAPVLSGDNGAGFGPGGGDQPGGVNMTPYLTTGIGSVEILLNSDNLYFGLLWGSVDNYNTLSFYKDNLLIGSITGSDVTASPNGDQGVQGTLYVNIISTDQAFNRVVATSSSFAFEFDNLAFSERIPTPVSEPGLLALMGLGLLGVAVARRRA